MHHTYPNCRYILTILHNTLFMLFVEYMVYGNDDLTKISNYTFLREDKPPKYSASKLNAVGTDVILDFKSKFHIVLR